MHLLFNRWLVNNAKKQKLIHLMKHKEKGNSWYIHILVICCMETDIGNILCKFIETDFFLHENRNASFIGGKPFSFFPTDYSIATKRTEERRVHLACDVWFQRLPPVCKSRHYKGIVDGWNCFLTSHSTIFQSHMWRYIDVQAVWIRNATARSAFCRIFPVPSKHRHGTTLSILFKRPDSYRVVLFKLTSLVWSLGRKPSPSTDQLHHSSDAKASF